MMQRVGNYYGVVRRTRSDDGHTTFLHIGGGGWDQLAAMEGVLCEDGLDRKIYIYTQDSFFTSTGRTQAYGKTIHGFVSYDSTLERWTFKAMGKYKDLLLDKAPRNAPAAILSQDSSHPG